MSAQDQDRSRDLKGARLALGGVLVLLAALYLAGYFFLGNRVAAGVDVGGVSIGGLTPERARARLEERLAPRVDDPITVNANGKSFTVDPDEAGLDFDLDATVAEAGGGRSWNPAQMLDVLWGAEDVAPVVTIDKAALHSVLRDLADEVDVAATEPSISFPGGRPLLRNGVPGLALDESAAAKAIAAAYLATDEDVTLPVAERLPEVRRSEVRSAMSYARTAVSGPVELWLPSRRVQLRVRAFAGALSLNANEGALTPTIDTDAFAGPVQRLLGRTASAPQDASVVLRNGHPVVVPARAGITVDVGQLADELRGALGEAGKARVVRIGTKTVRPDFTTRDARRLGIREVVSQFTTYFPYAEYRNTNQGRAAALINGTVLRPGDEFSFNKTVGERTRANGFVKGFIISDGVFAEDLGGGVSQVVTTTFNAAFFAGLEDIEHTPHSFYIDRYPVGREATVAWPSVDLKFGNDTPHGVLIQAWVVPSTPSRDGEMHVRMWSTKFWRIESRTSDRYNFTNPETHYDSSDTCVPQDGYDGFDIDVERMFYHGADLKKSETMHTTYTPSDYVYCQ